MPNDPDRPGRGADPTPHLTEGARAVRAVAAGVVLGAVLRLLSRRRSV